MFAINRKSDFARRLEQDIQYIRLEMLMHSGARVVHSSHENESLNGEEQSQVLGSWWQSWCCMAARPFSWRRWCYNQIISAPSHLSRIMAHLLTRAVMGGHVGHHGELMGLCHNWLADVQTISCLNLSGWLEARMIGWMCWCWCPRGACVPRLGLASGG